MPWANPADGPRRATSSNRSITAGSTGRYSKAWTIRGRRTTSRNSTAPNRRPARISHRHPYHGGPRLRSRQCPNGRDPGGKTGWRPAGPRMPRRSLHRHRRSVGTPRCRRVWCVDRVETRRRPSLVLGQPQDEDYDARRSPRSDRRSYRCAAATRVGQPTERRLPPADLLPASPAAIRASPELEPTRQIRRVYELSTDLRNRVRTSGAGRPCGGRRPACPTTAGAGRSPR